MLYPLFFFFFSMIGGLFVVRSKKRERERDKLSRLISLVENLTLVVEFFFMHALLESPRTERKLRICTQNPLSLSLSHTHALLKCTRRDRNARRKKKSEEWRSVRARVLLFSFFFFFLKLLRGACRLPTKIIKTLNKESKNRCVKHLQTRLTSEKINNHDGDALLSFPGDNNFRASGLFPLEQ